MQHANLAHGNMIANEVKIDLDVLGALVLDGVRRHVDGANVVAEHNRSWRRWSMKLVEELANPSSLGNGIGHSTVLSLSAGMRDRVLPLRRP
jgi:hypothetical protein